MNDIEIKEIKSDQAELYKKFLTFGLINDEENFRITPKTTYILLFQQKTRWTVFHLGLIQTIN